MGSAKPTETLDESHGSPKTRGRRSGKAVFLLRFAALFRFSTAPITGVKLFGVANSAWSFWPPTGRFTRDFSSVPEKQITAAAAKIAADRYEGMIAPRFF